MRRGFSLVELLVALVVLQVGLLGVVGMMLLSQRNMIRAELVFRATLEAESVADSLLRLGSSAEGLLPRAWGELRWQGGGVGGSPLEVTATGAVSSDTLAVVTAWPNAEAIHVPWAH